MKKDEQPDWLCTRWTIEGTRCGKPSAYGPERFNNFCEKHSAEIRQTERKEKK